MDSWQDTLNTIGFRPHGYVGAMRVILEGVEYIAIPHPLKGLSLCATYVSTRTAGQLEAFVPLDSIPQEVTRVMLELLGQLRPEFRDQ